MFIASLLSSRQAEDKLSDKSAFWFFRKKIIKVELIYLPMYLFSVKLEDTKGHIYSDKVSIDGIKGEFASFIEPEYKNRPEVKAISDFVLTEEEAKKVAEDEYSRYLFENNLKTQNKVRVTDLSPGIKIFYPFWIGYFKRQKAYDFNVIDAVNGSKQGVKMRPVFIELLLRISDIKNKIKLAGICY